MAKYRWDRSGGTVRSVPPFDLDEDEDTPVRRRSKKDTKKWCKGKVGVEHDYQLAPNHHNFKCQPHRTYLPNGEKVDEWWCNHETRCTKCGKYDKWYAYDVESNRGADICPDNPANQ